MAERGTAKVLGKLQKSLENGDYYEAHQMYLTVCNRYLKQNKTDDAVKLLSNGAKLLCQHKQYGSALELCQLLIDTWIEAEEDVKEEKLELFFDLLNEFPVTENQTFDFLKAGLKWTSKCGVGSNAGSLMHHQTGILYYETQKYHEAQTHFLQGTVDSAESLATLLIAQGKKGIESKNISSTEQLASMIIQPVLTYLSVKKLAHAFTVFNSFTTALVEIKPSLRSTSIVTSAHPDGKFLVLSLPILNFLQLMLITAQRGQNGVQEYLTLRRNFQTAGGPNENDLITQLLDRIGLVYFQIQPPRQQNNVLQDLMRSLFSGPDEAQESTGNVTEMD